MVTVALALRDTVTESLAEPVKRADAEFATDRETVRVTIVLLVEVTEVVTDRVEAKVCDLFAVAVIAPVLDCRIVKVALDDVDGDPVVEVLTVGERIVEPLDVDVGRVLNVPGVDGDIETDGDLDDLLDPELDALTDTEREEARLREEVPVTEMERREDGVCEGLTLRVDENVN